MSKTQNWNKKKKFCADGVFKAELHSLLQRFLESAGFNGAQIRTAPLKTEIILSVAKNKEVMGNDGRRMRELTLLIEKRFGYEKDQIQLKVQEVKRPGLCAQVQAEQMKFKLLNNIPVRLASNSIIKSIMADGAVGCEIKISGKLSQQRAKTMKYKSGYIISTGQPKNDFIDVAVRHVFFKQGIMGVQIKIMLTEAKHDKNMVAPDKVVFDDVKIYDNVTDIRAPEQRVQEPQQ